MEIHIYFVVALLAYNAFVSTMILRKLNKQYFLINLFKNSFFKLFIERIKNSIINQREFNGGVAQLVRAQDS